MSSHTGNSIIVTGVAILLLGLCCLAAALGDRTGSNLLGIGASVFALGVLMVAGGIYVNARMLQKQAAGTSKPEAAANQRSRGVCDLCRAPEPVIHCKVHQLHLCADCLGAHYDFRSCVYVPSTRRGSSRPGKSMAAHGA